MSRPSVLIVLVAVLGAAALATGFAAVGRARAQRDKQAAPVAGTTTTVARSVDQAPPLAPVRAAPRPPSPSFSIADVKPGRTIALRAKPNGRVLAQVGSSTEFGSRTALAVAATRGDW